MRLAMKPITIEIHDKDVEFIICLPLYVFKICKKFFQMP